MIVRPLRPLKVWDSASGFAIPERSKRSTI